MNKLNRVFATLLWVALPGLPGIFAVPARADLHGESTEPYGVPSELRPVALENVGVDQKLGTRLSPDLGTLPFRDELGNTVALGNYLGGPPLILVPVYYHCPNLCSSTLDHLTELLRALPFEMGKEYRVVTFSFDPTDQPRTALAKKRTYLARYARGAQSDANPGWHFLTGTEPAIRRLASRIGYRYKIEPRSGEYSHGSAFLVLTPDGTISRYFSGFQVSPFDLRLAIVEASRGRVGSAMDSVLLYCFHYDPSTGRYGPAILVILRICGVITVLALGGLVYCLGRRERPA